MKNNRLLNAIKFFRLTSILEKEMVSLNKQLKIRQILISTVIGVVISEKQSIERQDLTFQIQIINKEIFKYGQLKAVIDDFIIRTKNTKVFGDFETTNIILVDLLNSFYDILNVYKKINIKNSVPTSKVAKDSVAYSLSTLSGIINGN